jgi:hypothetical protein
VLSKVKNILLLLLNTFSPFFVILQIAKWREEPTNQELLLYSLLLLPFLCFFIPLRTQLLNNGSSTEPLAHSEA